MISESDLRPGDIFVTPTYGSGFDRFVGASIRYLTATKDEYGIWHDAKGNHAGIYVGDGKIVEAEPGGARLSPVTNVLRNAYWSVNGLQMRRIDGTMTPIEPLSEIERSTLVDEACKLLGIPYGFLDIAAIAVAQRRVGGFVNPAKSLHDQPWWVRRIESQHTLICSQLVDLAYHNAGIHLFEDNRIPGLVSPNDLFGLYL